MGIVVGFDAIHANISHLPAGHQAAGYVTGSSEIVWTNADWQAHPNAVRIDQSPSASIWDATADVDDFENGAVALDELAPRAKERMASFKNVTRPGQREPAVYMSASNISAVVNALIAGGVHSGVGLYVAHFGVSESDAVLAVQNASGPFPIIGFQFANGTFFDSDIFSSQWLNNVSKKPTPPPVDWSAHSGWVKVDGTNFWFNHNAGTLGYEDRNGTWHKVHLP